MEEEDECNDFNKMIDCVVLMKKMKIWCNELRERIDNGLGLMGWEWKKKVKIRKNEIDMKGIIEKKKREDIMFVKNGEGLGKSVRRWDKKKINEISIENRY